MRTSVLFTAAVSLLIASFAARAGRLDIAVMQFADDRDPSMIAEAVSQVNLLKVTDSDRTETNVAGLRGGNVIFVQSMGAIPGSPFTTSTRLGNMRADVTGTLNGSSLSVKVSLLEGVKVGIRKYRESVYEGSGSVAPGSAHLIVVRQSSGITKTMKKNRPETGTYNMTTIIVAQYTP